MVRGRHKIFTEEEAKERKRIYMSKWQHENKEKIKEYNRIKNLNNFEENSIKYRCYYEDNKEKICQNQKNYYNNNIEKKREYYQTNKDILKAKRDAVKAALKEK